jgi:hypothetical protein
VKTILNSLLLTLLFVSQTPAAEPSAAPPPLLRDHGLRSGPPAETLPQNAIVHLQINQPQRIIESVERLLVSTIPEKLLPPPLQDLLGQPHPLLTMLGMQSIGAPLTADQIAEKFGVATDRAATLTLYPGLPPGSFILSLPIKNHAAFESAYRSLFRSQKAEAMSLGGKSFVRVALGHRQLPELFAACSSDRVFITGDQSLLFLLYPDNSFPRLKTNPHFANVISQEAQEDIWLTFDPELVKPLLAPLEFFQYVPLQLLAQNRAKLLRQIPPQQREIIEQRLRLQFGIRNLEEFADYAECAITATYEELFQFVFTSLKSFNGVTLAAKFDPAFPQFSAALHSKQYRSDSGTGPIPMDAVRTALSRVPGQHNHLSVSGRQAKIEPSALVTSWLKRVRSGFEAKHLNLAFVETLEKLHRETVRPQPIAAQVPWVIKTRTAVNPSPSAADHDSLQKYFEKFAASLAYPAGREITIIPSQGENLLENSLRAEREALMKNRALVEKTFSGDSSLESFIETVYRLNRRDLEGGVKELTWETAFVTRGGFFGFNQHELVSRRTYFSRTLGDYTLFHQASKDARWIREVQLQPNARLSPGLAKLLDRVPKDANFVSIHRPLTHVPELLNWAQAFEDLIHRDAGAYLSQARRAVEGVSDKAELSRKLESVKFSPVVATVNRDPASGELYCLLPGNLAFPRPKLVPAVQKLFAEFNRSADDVGGFLCYTRTTDGRTEASLIQSTEGISRLIKTIGNAVQAQYLADPSKMAGVQQMLVTDRDKGSKRMEEIVVRNPSWEFLPRMNVGGRLAKPKVQTEAKPKSPTASRDPQAPANLIDLSRYYNASLKDSWHSGATADNDLSALPQGIQEFAGVKFDVRGIVQVSGQSAAEQLSVRFPREVKEIAIGRSCGQLHVLHGAGWTSPDGTKIGSFIAHYQDGKTEEIPIVYGTHVRDWWTPPGEQSVTGSTVAWKGANTASKTAQMSLQLYKTTWKNPRPETAISTLDYVSAMAPSAPFLIAVTAE